MAKSTIRFATFPRTEPPQAFVRQLVDLFQSHESAISTTALPKGLTSDEALAVLAEDLVRIGFQVETGKRKDQKIERPVFYGENGKPTLNYQIDAYQPEWRCGLEVEAGRAWMGNAVYRDLIQACVMVGVDHLCLAVPNCYRYKSGQKDMVSTDFKNTVDVAEAVYGHSRVRLPYRLIVLGY
jgi:hypothetical protein